MQKSGHYIKRKTQHGAPRDTRELEAMLDDMLVPPSDEDGQLVARFQIGLNLSASRVGIGFGGLRRQIG